jgi:hypothetical protein
MNHSSRYSESHLNILLNRSKNNHNNYFSDNNDIKRVLSQESNKDECKDYEHIPSILPAVRRIVAIGDIHGDWDAMVKTLKLAKVINDKLEWNGNDTVIVQVGDQIDRCRPYKYTCDNPKATIDDENSDEKILKFFTELNTKARLHGGRVITLLGNHEIMNVQGNMTYVSYEGFKHYKDGIKGRREAFEPGAYMAKFLACTRLACVVIGSNIFVHAGIVPGLINNMTIDEINILVRKWLLKQINVDNMYNIISSDKISPFWPRVFGSIPPISTDHPNCHKYLEPVLHTIQNKHMIIGHTPQIYVNSKIGINSTCNNKLWRIDVGISRAFQVFDEISKDVINRKIQVLEILNDDIFNILEL